jgi:type IV secretory pathway VirB10-like protein
MSLGTTAAAPGPRPSAEAQKLLDRQDARRAEAASRAARLKQRTVGDEFQFDSDGNILGPPTDANDLPRNRPLGRWAGAPETAAEISREIRRDEPDEGKSSESGRRELRSEEKADKLSEDRAVLTQSMLGYSTVPGATWAARRPQRGASSNETEQKEESESAMERAMLKMVEQLGEGRGPVAGGDKAGTRTEPSSSMGSLPAERTPQAFARGGVGDMRIGGAVGPDQVVRQGKFLDCAVVNELKVDLAEAPVVVMVSRDFVSLDGAYVLVPAGTKLLGTAGQVQHLQQARVYIKFDRMILPDQRSAYFPVRQVSAVDATGAVGISGEVDRHFFLQFGAAVMLGLLDGLAAAIETPSTSGPPALRELVMARTSSNFSAVVGNVINRYGNVVPTVTVQPGTKMKVFFSEDVMLSPYMRTSDLSWVKARGR